MLNYWIRLTELPDDCLAKIALREHAILRTNWIKTIEHLIRTLDLNEQSATENVFKRFSKGRIQQYFETSWANGLSQPDHPRQEFYKLIKEDLSPAKHLDLQQFDIRQVISKIRCSNHTLEIEKGRHRAIHVPRENRLCIQCDEGAIEDELHFLLECKTYEPLRLSFSMNCQNIHEFLNGDQENLGKYLLRAFSLRDSL